MKYFVYAILMLLIATGCSKTTDVKPQNNTTATTTTGTTAPVTIPTGLSQDDSVHLVAFHANPQSVNTSVSGSNLVMIYNENIDLLFTEAGYQKTSAIHLDEDFSNSLLAGFNYTTVAEGGNITSNWVDDNLNNVVLKTISDTLINNTRMVKINVHRQFTFYTTYDSAAIAVNEQNILVAKIDDVIGFSSYCYYNLINYPKTATSAKVVYSK